MQTPNRRTASGISMAALDKVWWPDVAPAAVRGGAFAPETASGPSPAAPDASASTVPTQGIPGVAPPRPGQTEVFARAQRARVYEGWRAGQWDKLVSTPHAQDVHGMLNRGDVFALDLQISHMGAQLSCYQLNLRSAEMRRAQDEIAPNREKANMYAVRLNVTAMLVTASNLPIGTKLNILTSIRNRLHAAGVPMEMFDCTRESYLHVALRSSTSGFNLGRLLQFFVEAGADVNQADGGFNTPLSLLKDRTDVIPALVSLLVAGADPNAPDGTGCTPMHHFAAHAEAIEALNHCLMKGGNLHAVTVRGETLLHMLVVKHDNPQVIHYLLERGVQADARDFVGMSAEDYAGIMKRPMSQAMLAIATLAARSAALMSAP